MDSHDLDIEVLGESNATISDVIRTGCRMFGRLYGAKCDTTMNALRYKIFSTRLKVPCLKSLPRYDVNCMHVGILYAIVFTELCRINETSAFRIM